MEKSAICAVHTLIGEADKILKEYGLQMEKEVLTMIKSASFLIWTNANPETEENLVYWITDIELYIEERIVELHKARIQQYLTNY